MIEHIHIENFKSLKNVSLDLQRVNVLIGPNNSGKTNFLKSFIFLKNVRWGQNAGYKEHTFRHEEVELALKITGFGNNSFEIRINKNKNDDHQYPTRSEFFNGFDKIEGLPPSVENNIDLILLVHILNKLQLYSPNPLKFTDAQAIDLSSTYINEDASNLVSFLETLRDEYRENFAEIESDLRQCVPEFYDIRFRSVEAPDGDKRTYKKWGLYSPVDKLIYWAEELSEGVLYFVALLCVIHQPNPPQLLLLEEPERGIHPRRIREVIQFIKQLAYQKNIQVILTTHSPMVLDEFAETPESVFVFDKDEEGATLIRNLQKDIIEPENAKRADNGMEPVDYTDALGENWTIGFLGGVPLWGE